jgi:hypothetical protein
MAMSGYAYNAALWCDECANAVALELDAKNVEDTGDTDDYPQFAGDSESDMPDHCDGCNVFLENPLTTDGRSYVEDACRDAIAAGRLESIALTVWAPFYGIELEDASELEDDTNESED